MPGIKPGSNRARMVALIALLVLTGIALRGHLPGAGRSTPAEPSHNPAAGIAVIALLGAAIVIMTVAIVASLRQPRPARHGAQHLNRASGGQRTRPSLRMLLIVLGVILAWLIVVVLLLELSEFVDLGHPPAASAPSTAAPAAGPAPPPQASPPQGPKQPGGDAFWYLFATTMFMLVLWTAGMVVALVRHRRAQTVQPVIGEAAEPPLQPGPHSLAVAAERGLAEMGDLQPRTARGDHCLLRRDGGCARELTGSGATGLGHALRSAGPGRRPRCDSRRHRDRAGGPVRRGPVQPARDERRASGGRGARTSAGARGTQEPGMNKLVVLGLGLVVAMETMGFVMAGHRFVMWVSGAAAALVLLAGRRLLDRESGVQNPELLADGPAESMRRWIARTETMVRWADSSRRDWDRHLRPRLAREFIVATGQRVGKDPASLQATGRMVFGDDLWQWVDPSNVAQTGGHEPGPGRAALSEILERLEQV